MCRAGGLALGDGSQMCRVAFLPTQREEARASVVQGTWCLSCDWNSLPLTSGIFLPSLCSEVASGTASCGLGWSLKPEKGCKSGYSLAGSRALGACWEQVMLQRCGIAAFSCVNSELRVRRGEAWGPVGLCLVYSRSKAKRCPGCLAQRGGFRWRQMVLHACEGKALQAGWSGSFSWKLRGSVCYLYDDDCLTGGDERSGVGVGRAAVRCQSLEEGVELSKGAKVEGRWLPFSGRGFLEGQRKDGRRAVSA